NHPMRRAGSSGRSRTNASITPCTSPRQPPCASATIVPSRSDKKTGTQSAVRTAHATFGCCVQIASAAGGGAVTSPSSARTTLVPCTWFSQTMRSTPQRARNRSRCDRTCDGSSPVCSAKLPLARVVTSAPTRWGTDQSGAITSSSGDIGSIRTQHAKQAREIRRQLALELHVSTSRWMVERDPPRMQCLPSELPNRLDQHVRRSRRQPTAGTVSRVTHQRMPYGAHVHPNLMRASRLELRFEVRMCAESFQHAHARDRGSTLVEDTLLQAVPRVATDRRIDSPSAGPDALGDRRVRDARL